MGYIDADAHVLECEHTWDFFDPGEEVYRPTMTDGHWQVEDMCIEFPGPSLGRYRDMFPPGTVDLSDPAARVRYMDDLGIDVHVMFPTYCLLTEARNPITQAAMSRSYNRWLAERTSQSGGRLAWVLDAPVQTTERCLEELEFGKEHGAVGVLLRGLGHERGLGNPMLTPVYEKAQDLDLAVTLHVGGDWRTWRREWSAFLYASIMPVPGGLWAVLAAGLLEKFPRIRWAFLESGASWLPWVLQERFRADEKGATRGFTDWRAAARDVLRRGAIFVGAYLDDDLPSLVEFAGDGCLVHGTDFGHVDIGSDPNGLHVIATRDDLDAAAARRIVDDNARRLYGIDPTFRPAPPPSYEGPVFEPGLVRAN
jgi:predicted TIM-barrel fold metal-dependent hydrolase